MKKEIIREIEIPAGINVDVNGKTIKISGKNGIQERKFRGNFLIERKDNKLIILNKKSTKKEKKEISTTAAHIKNMMKGAEENYEYRLKICFAHFPMTVAVEKNELIIKNFLGEVKLRKAKLIDGVNVKVDKEIIIVTSNDKEKAGQTAANIEAATKIKNRDRRVFQDGIFIISKPDKD